MIQYTLNMTFWVVLLAMAGRGVWLARFGNSALSLGWRVTSVVATFSLLIVWLALHIGYVAPLAIMQDVVAAQQALQGRPLPTTDLRPYVKSALEEEPTTVSLGAIWPRLGQEDQEEYNSVPKIISEQAHPPFMTLFVTPLVYFLGVHGTFLAMALLSIASLGVALVLLRRGMGLELTPTQKTLVIFLFLGWYPMFWVLRAGQSGALISGLIVLSWYCIRQRRPLWGGIALGIATSLKIVPVLLLVYFLLRHRRALLSGVLTIVLLNLFTVAFFGHQSYEDYFQTARFVADRYGRSLDNWSLLSALHRVSEGLGVSFLGSKPIYLGLSLAIVGGLCGMVLLKKGTSGFLSAHYDQEYSLFVAAMPLLSPICWSHYFVLLLLPLAVLAKVAIRQNASVWTASGFLALFMVLAVPADYSRHLVAFVQNISWRLGLLLLLLPSFALISIVIWIANLARALPEQRGLALE